MANDLTVVPTLGNDSGVKFFLRYRLSYIFDNSSNISFSAWNTNYHVDENVGRKHVSKFLAYEDVSFKYLDLFLHLLSNYKGVSNFVSNQSDSIFLYNIKSTRYDRKSYSYKANGKIIGKAFLEVEYIFVREQIISFLSQLNDSHFLDELTFWKNLNNNISWYGLEGFYFKSGKIKFILDSLNNHGQIINFGSYGVEATKNFFIREEDFSDLNKFYSARNDLLLKQINFIQSYFTKEGNCTSMEEFIDKKAKFLSELDLDDYVATLNRDQYNKRLSKNV